jgi:hypothetical protein
MATNDVYVLVKTSLIDFARHPRHNFYPTNADQFMHHLHVVTEASPEMASWQEGSPLPPPRLPKNYDELAVKLYNTVMRLSDGHLSLLDDQPKGDLGWVVKRVNGKDACAVYHHAEGQQFDVFDESRMRAFCSSMPYLMLTRSVDGGKPDGSVYSGCKQVGDIRQGVVTLKDDGGDLEFLIRALSDSKRLGKHALPFSVKKRK